MKSKTLFNWSAFFIIVAASVFIVSNILKIVVMPLNYVEKETYDKIAIQLDETEKQLDDTQYDLSNANDKVETLFDFIDILSNKKDKGYKLALQQLAEFSKWKNAFIYGNPEQRKEYLDSLCYWDTEFHETNCPYNMDLEDCLTKTSKFVGQCFNDNVVYKYFYAPFQYDYYKHG